MSNKHIYTNQNLELYIKSKQNAWSANTIKSTKARLSNAFVALNSVSGDLHSFYKLLNAEKYNKYTIKQIFIQLSAFSEQLDCFEVKNFVRQNALLFKNAYEKERLALDFDEAVTRIKTIKNEPARKLALAMMRTGLRAHEAIKYDGSGSVVGKGAKPRAVYLQEDLSALRVNYKQLYKELRMVGLKPHSLRKLAATRLVEKGLKEADLMAILGWNSMQTASSYLQPSKEIELKERLKNIFNF